jgi:hypothetical protein
VLAGELGRDEPKDLGVDLDLGQVDGLDLELAAQDLGELHLAHVAHGHDAVPEPRTVAALLEQRLLELLGGQEFLLEQKLADALLAGRDVGPLEDAVGAHWSVRQPRKAGSGRQSGVTS